MSYAVGGRDARAFYPVWNLDYKSPAGIFVCWRFSLFQKRYIPVCVCMCVCQCMCVSFTQQNLSNSKETFHKLRVETDMFL